MLAVTHFVLARIEFGIGLTRTEFGIGLPYVFPNAGCGLADGDEEAHKPIQLLPFNAVTAKPWDSGGQLMVYRLRQKDLTRLFLLFSDLRP